MSPSPQIGLTAPETSPSRRARIRWWRRFRARLRMLRRRMRAHPLLHWTWRIGVGAVGAVILLAGLVMFLTPGPGIAGVLLGLVILATEFHWARSLLRRARRWAHRAKESVMGAGRCRRRGAPVHDEV